MIYFIGPIPIILHEKSEMPLFSILARLKKFFDWKKASKIFQSLMQRLRDLQNIVSV